MCMLLCPACISACKLVCLQAFVSAFVSASVHSCLHCMPACTALWIVRCAVLSKVSDGARTTTVSRNLSGLGEFEGGVVGFDALHRKAKKAF